ncbi:hypothetical protein MB02_15555 [Croceicoccus estronivorus]|uniref:nuclear transport factor 2 family protein n=1 Tax=Croceicoccus estronivorus TaxID=1172626 RepID=UPI00082B67A5|nr:nuclear transport factor 2 family protein [Croceicoccus estronivorus]OCC22816.1 hypothetical protein MB02_15555 [Croceicoccus estronivorus]
MDLREVADRLEINEVIARYCHALDLKDWPAFRALFTEDAALDFTAFDGPKGGVSDVEAFLRPIVESLAGTQHMTSAVMIDLDGDEASARSAAIVPMTANEGGVEKTMFNGLWYEDKLVRTPSGWRFRERTQVRGWVFTPA